MSSNKERYFALQTAAMEQDFEKLRSFVADDFYMVEPGSVAFSGRFEGPEGLVEVVRRIRELYEIDIVSSTISEAENNVVLCEFVFGFKSLRTGERVEMPVVDVFRYSPDGKLLRIEAYYQDPAKVAAIA